MKPRSLKDFHILVFVAFLMFFITACGTSTARTIRVTEADRIAEIYHDTPCYSGPGPSYDLVTMLMAGTEVVIFGVAQKGEYVVVENPDTPPEHCWAALVDILTTDYLMGEFMKLNLGDTDDDGEPNDLIIELKLIELDAAQPGITQQSASGPPNPTSTFRKRDVPVPSTRTHTPFVPPVSGDLLDAFVPTLVTESPFGPTVLVTHDTLCWRGPGAAYDVVHALFEGQEAKAMGQDEKFEWYILESPLYPGVNCWAGKEAVLAPDDMVVWPIFPVPPLPIRTVEPGSDGGSPVCSASISTRDECEAAGGGWNTVAPGCNC